MDARPGEAPPVCGPAPSPSWTRRFWTLWIVLLGVRIGYAFVFPLDLAPDESYYWDWGRRLDIGYYSKPPMIGWLMGLAGFLGGNTEAGLKMFPAVLSTCALIFVFLLGRSMFDARTGFWAAALMAASPASAALGAFFTIDAPLMVCWSASLYFAWRCLNETGAAQWRSALGLSVCLGLGFLTKQIQCVFPLMFVVALWVSRGSRTPLGAGKLLVILVVPFLFLLPPLIWNWQHAWITFRHTAEEIEHRPWVFAKSVKFVGEFLGGQAGLGGGLTWFLLVIAWLRAVRRWGQGDGRLRFLTVFSLPGILVFLGLSVFQRVEQNWPMVFYVAAMVLAAGVLLSGSKSADPTPRVVRVAVRLGAILGVLLLLVPFALPGSPWSGSRGDPTARVRGWRALAQAVDPVRRALPDPERTFILAPDDRYAASALAFYLPDQPRTHCWESPDRIESQYGIWGRPGAAYAGWNALVVARNPLDPKLKDVAGRFDKWENRGVITVSLGQQTARDRRYEVFLGRGFRPDEMGGSDGKQAISGDSRRGENPSRTEQSH